MVYLCFPAYFGTALSHSVDGVSVAEKNLLQVREKYN
jgi:hypothetical protein